MQMDILKTVIETNLTLISTAESEDKLKKYEEICSKIKEFVTSTNNNSDDYNENI